MRWRWCGIQTCNISNSTTSNSTTPAHLREQFYC